MTVVQKILRDLKNNNTTNQIVECFETKDMKNGYYKLSLTNGKYSYVTNENFLKIKPYICYKERDKESPIDRFLETIKFAYEEYKNSQMVIKE